MITTQEIETALRAKGFIKNKIIPNFIYANYDFVQPNQKYFVLNVDYNIESEYEHGLIIHPEILIEQLGDDFIVLKRNSSKESLVFSYNYDKSGNEISEQLAFLHSILREQEIFKTYFFKKQHVEYGTIDYGINELIEDLKLWL